MSYGFLRHWGSDDELNSELSEMFRQRRQLRKSKENKVELCLVGLLFARPTEPFAMANIIPDLDYFNTRSGSHVDLFCAGYIKEQDEKQQREIPPVAVIDGTRWWFDNDRFNKVREEIERQSKWKYSGGTDLLLANARSNIIESHINYHSMIACDLQQMQADKAIVSVQQFLEKIAQYSEIQNVDNPVFGLSDEFGESLTSSAIKKFILKLLPPGLAEEYTKARHFVVSDFSIK